jgi:hypothetical protein
MLQVDSVVEDQFGLQATVGDEQSVAAQLGQIRGHSLALIDAGR